MEGSIVPAAIAASRRVAERHGLSVERTIVLQDSNRLTVRLAPCDVVVRIAPRSRRAAAAREVTVADALAPTGAPVAPLDARFEPHVHDEDDFVLTFWAYCPPDPTATLGAGEYADALASLHDGMRSAGPVTGLGHCLDRVAEALALVDDDANVSPISATERNLVRSTLRDGGSVVAESPSEQLLHGEPHPGNVIRTDTGLVFVDLETSCRGPIEFDIAHATITEGAPPTDVADRYPGADADLVRACWHLTLALAIAWRFEPGDDLPDGAARARDWARQLQVGDGVR